MDVLEEKQDKVMENLQVNDSKLKKDLSNKYQSSWVVHVGDINGLMMSSLLNEANMVKSILMVPLTLRKTPLGVLKRKAKIVGPHLSTITPHGLFFIIKKSPLYFRKSIKMLSNELKTTV